MSELNKTGICPICQTQMVGSFCHGCGQQATGAKTGPRDIAEALLSGFFSVERGIWGTMAEMIRNPRKVIEHYWDGYRLYYYSPGQMILYTIFVIGLHIALVNNSILGFRVTLTGLSSGTATIFSPQLFYIALTLPFFATTTFVTFFRYKRRFSEHFVAATYIFCAAAIFCTILSDLLYFILDFPMEITAVLFLGLKFLWACRVHLQTTKWRYYFLGFFAQVLVMSLLWALVLAVLILINPDLVSFSRKE